MDTDRGFVQARHRADLSRRAVTVMAQGEDRSLTPVQPIDRRRELRAALTREQRALGIARAAAPARCPRFIGARDVVGDEPAIPPRACLPAIEAAVDENPREPDLERP